MMYQFRTQYLSTLFIMTVMSLASVAQAAKTVTVLDAPPQAVELDGEPGRFEMLIEFCEDHQPTRSGFASLYYLSGPESHFIPLWATRDPVTGAILVILAPEDISDPFAAGTDGDILLSVVPVPNRPGESYIDFKWDTGGVFHSEPPAPFVAYVVPRTQRGGDCAPIDYGQLDARVSVSSPLQPVVPEPQQPPSDIEGFEAGFRFDQRHRARGFFDVLSAGQTFGYEPFFGAAFRDSNAEVRIVVYALINTRSGVLNSNDHVMRATGGTAPPDPNCLIWDLLNGSTGQTNNNGTFEAQGDIRITGPDIIIGGSGPDAIRR